MEEEILSMSDHDEIEEDDDESIDKIDPHFKKFRTVIVYICLPSGQEEIMIDYEMTFADR